MLTRHPPAARAWYAVVLFYLAYTLSFIDRQIMSFLVAPIRSDLHLSDFQFSLINGLAFVIFYSIFGIPLARLADRSNRRNIMIGGVLVWSVATMACGLATGYWELFAARIVVGMGEAAVSPTAVSMIADLFAREKRALPISFYSAGVHGGAGMANIFGGLIAGYVMSGAIGSLPILGSLKAWQLTFALVGLPGLLVAPLLLTVREPARRERTAGTANPTFGEALRYLKRHRIAFGALMLGSAFSAMAAYGSFAWVPALYARRFHWGAAVIGPYFGLIILVCGTGGLLLGGSISNKLTRARRSGAFIEVMIVSMLIAVVPAASLLAVDNPYWTLGCLALMVALLSTPVGLTQAAIQAITPNEMRAQMIALYLLFVALFGNAVGSSAVAALTDYYFRRDAAIGSSISIVATVGSALSVLVLWSGLGAYRRSAQALDQTSQAG